MQRWIVMAMLALVSACVFGVFILQDIRALPDTSTATPPWGLILRYAVAMTTGGAVVGYLLSGLFGRSGIAGWALALLGGLIATSMSSLLGSAFGLLPDLAADGLSTTEIIEIAAGLLVLPLAASEQPVVLLFVIGMVLVTHSWCKRARSN